jgi:hypothetical protein
MVNLRLVALVLLATCLFACGGDDESAGQGGGSTNSAASSTGQGAGGDSADVSASASTSDGATTAATGGIDCPTFPNEPGEELRIHITNGMADAMTILQGCHQLPGFIIDQNRTLGAPMPDYDDICPAASHAPNCADPQMIVVQPGATRTIKWDRRAWDWTTIPVECTDPPQIGALEYSCVTSTLLEEGVIELGFQGCRVVDGCTYNHPTTWLEFVQVNLQESDAFLTVQE